MPVAKQFVDALANEALKRLTRRTITCLQQMKDGPICSHADSILANVWDEICVQVQAEESAIWSAYEYTVNTAVRSEVSRLSALERAALWLQTNNGFDWWCYHDDDDESVHAPVDLDEVVDFVSKAILDQAANWSNPRIRAFLESSYEMD